MNCEQIKEKINIRTVLESFNLFPAKENRKTAFYFALDREEKIPSLSVDFIKNKAFDFGTGRNYDIISIVQQMNKCSVADALEYLQKLDFPVVRNDKIEEIAQGENYRIIKINQIQHPALVQYLKSRRVYGQKNLVKEITYVLNGKKYFGIGFLNNSGGFEIRNKYTKICLGKKDVSWIKNGRNLNNEVLIFEGFFDYLTYRNIEREENSVPDHLILNSTAMLFKIKQTLKIYDKISLFLDNDHNGKATKEMIQNDYKNVDDCSLLYFDYNDLNEWFCNVYDKL